MGPSTFPATMLILAQCFLVIGLRRSLAASDPDEDIVNTWRFRDKHYPAYCSSPKNMEERTLPPLDLELPGMRILQVITVHRHGARTPWTGESLSREVTTCIYRHNAYHGNMMIYAPPRKRGFVFRFYYCSLYSVLLLTYHGTSFEPIKPTTAGTDIKRTQHRVNGIVVSLPLWLCLKKRKRS